MLIYITNIARWLFRILPINNKTKLKIAFYIFAISGNLFRNVPAFQIWQQEQLWHKIRLPDNIIEHNAKILTKYTNQTEITPSFLMISHNLGGGTKQHVEFLAKELGKCNINIYILENHNNEYFRIFPRVNHNNNILLFKVEDDIEYFYDFIRKLNIIHIHLHHTMDLGAEFLDFFSNFIKMSKIPYDFTIHDYFSICPRFTLFDESTRGYCGEPYDVRKCSACVKRYGSVIGDDVDVAKWRRQYMQLLSNARAVFAPCKDVKERMQKYVNTDNFLIKPHPEHSNKVTLPAKKHKNNKTLEIAIIGGIAPHKGSKVIFECAKDAIKRKLPINFTLIGYSDIDAKLRNLDNFKITGRFSANELPNLLISGNYDMAFLPSIIPETYNYVLSELLRNGMFTVCFDIGAISERIREINFGEILPLEWHLYPNLINDRLLSIDPKTPIPRKSIENNLIQYKDIIKDYYNLTI